ncbi:MAG: N-acetylmuramoyl-L-alanine amidase, partial [Alphaproteobacteria bacterium]|nr:N-acetylmuramoyl-L-alanine amidase [Alphaproteobacteria bacterium]
HVSGVGEWVKPSPIIDQGPRLALGDENGDVHTLQLALADFGYGVVLNGKFDETTQDVVTAFQRHFRPARVDGVADDSTLRTLDALLHKRRAEV